MKTDTPLLKTNNVEYLEIHENRIKTEEDAKFK